VRQTLAAGAPEASRSIKINEEYLNWTWLHSKKKAATDAAICFLVTFDVALTLIALIAVFGVRTSIDRVVAAAGRKPQTVKEPSDWSSSPEVEALKDALDVQSLH
jgi:hypothetical protein